MQSPPQMLSPLQLIDLEIRGLVLRFNAVRCRNLLEAETDPARRQQLHELSNAANFAEARFLISRGRAGEFNTVSENSQDMTALLSRDGEQREPRKCDQASNVIDFEVAKKGHVDRARRSQSNGSRDFSRQWPLMSNAQQARRIAAFRRAVSQRIARVKLRASSDPTRKPPE